MLSLSEWKKQYMQLQRYARITNSAQKREAVLLKALPCQWGRCTFCNYIDDNSNDVEQINAINLEVLKNVTGEFAALMVINSGSCFELPAETLQAVKQVVSEKQINRLYFEAHWSYRHKLAGFKNQFSVPITFITGIETFNEHFRNHILGKGVCFKDFAEIRQYFQAVCIMVGMQGQTKEMIAADVKILLREFEHGTINLYVDNNMPVKADYNLQKWFKDEYAWLNDEESIDVLWSNIDFGVGTPTL
jgi:hypothetical protein